MLAELGNVLEVRLWGVRQLEHDAKVAAVNPKVRAQLVNPGVSSLQRGQGTVSQWRECARFARIIARAFRVSGSELYENRQDSRSRHPGREMWAQAEGESAPVKPR